MSGIYIPDFKVPEGCMGCEYRDAESGGDCGLMLRNPSETYAEQYRLCPIKKLFKNAIQVPSHGKLYDENKIYEMFKAQWDDEYNSTHKPKCTWSTALSAAYDLITMLDATLPADRESEE